MADRLEKIQRRRNAREKRVIRVLADSGIPYKCLKCGKRHRGGTDVHSKHGDYIDLRSIDKGILMSAKRGERIKHSKNVKEHKTHKDEWDREAHDKAYKSLQKAKQTFPRYYAYTSNSSYGFGMTGRLEGYNSLEELHKAQRYSINKAKKGDGIFIIVQGKIVRTIDGFKK